MFPEHFKHVGLLSKTHGIHGTVVLRMDRNFDEDLDEGEFLFVAIDDTKVPFLIENVRFTGDDAFIKFAEVNSEIEAELIKSRIAYIPAQKDPEQLDDLGILKGFIFRDETSGKKGIIIEYHDQPDNPLFTVEIDDKEFLIPVHQEFIQLADIDSKTIVMRLPEGIFELEE